MKKIILTVVKFTVFFSIGLFFIWLFIHNLSAEDKKSILHSFWEADFFWISVSVIIGLISHLIRTLRWRILLGAMDYKPGVLNTFAAIMVAYFANLAIPRLGEITRCGVLKKYENIPFPNSFGTVVAERALDVLTFLLLFAVNILIQFDKINNYVQDKIYEPLKGNFNFINDPAFIVIFCVFLILMVFVLLVFNKKLKEFKIFKKISEVLKGFWQGLKSLTKIKQPLLFVIYTLLLWTAYFFTLYVCIFSLNETSVLNGFAPYSVLVFGTIGMMLVQGGVGIYPAIAAETLVIYGIPSLSGYTYGWLAWTSQTLTIIIFGILSLIILPALNKKRFEHAKA